MTTVTELKGIAWDHPRAYEPLNATSKEFAKSHQGLVIHWDVRSLKAFGDMPIEDLIDRYDLITIDHPYMGQAYANELLIPLEDKLSSFSVRELADQSVGPSFKSYYYKNHLFALPIDAAAMVAASKKELITKFNLILPKTRQELLGFYKRCPKAHAVAWPLGITDLWCTFLSLCAQDGGRNFIQKNTIDAKIGSAVLDEIKQHLEYVHPESLNWNPIQVLDRMSADDEIIYSPYLFGYTNYSRERYGKNIVYFSNSPTNPMNNVSTILGGVGLAISAKCQQVDLAVAYVDYVAKAEIQESIYTRNGGQPGSLRAWENAANNMICHDFFKNTLTTMEKAYVRPRHKGWNEFQAQGAELLHNGIVKNSPSPALMRNLNELYQSTC